ncbi:MAG: insulinase family protein [Bacteroidales bacterium]|nr:insulinase family protein [Bacteroidales bacterium]MBN2756606.1 insulinase family protein [Bacteroidales bacterium]
MEYQAHSLKNGIRIVHCHSDSNIAYSGLILNTGSRDEKENEHGLAHFFEHAIFKGTHKRRAYHILNSLENVGGDLNAFTTKEDTCIHAAFLSEHYARTLDLISDIVFQSTFPEKEIEKEKDVIIDEINSYKDNPSELIFDEFEDMIFKTSSLGRNILGTSKKIKSYKKDDIIRFMNNNYSTDQIILFSIGNIKFQKLVNLSEKYFGEIPEKIIKKREFENLIYTPVNKTVKKKTHQIHCIIGNLAYNIWDNKRTAFSLLNNLLGGNTMNSRLSMALREKSGFVYDIESNYTSYSDTGAFNIYFGTDKDKLDKSLKLIFKEYDKLKNNKLGTLQLKRAKQQLIGQIAISSENKDNAAYNMGKSLLIYDKIDSLSEINQKINNINASDILEVANEILNPDNLSILIYE